MNETMKTILTRRSTRKFKVQELPEAELEQILQAALYAPSGMSKQTWQFTVVKNREKIQLLAKAVEKALGRERYDMYSLRFSSSLPTRERIIMEKRTMPAPWKISSWPLIPLESARFGSTSFRASAMSLRSGKS